MIGSSIIASVGLGVVFEYGRFYERNLMSSQSSLAQQQQGKKKSLTDGAETDEQSSPSTRPVFQYSTRLKINTAIWFLILCSVEYLLVPRKWNPFTYTKQQEKWSFGHQIFAMTVFSSWTTVLVVGFGLFIVMFRSLHHARIVLNDEREAMNQQQLKLQQQQQAEIRTSPTKSKAGAADDKDDELLDSTIEIDANFDDGISCAVSTVLETVSAFPRPKTPPAVWSSEMKGAFLEQKDVGLAQQAIEDRWKSLEGRNVQLEQLRVLKQQQENRLKILRARRHLQNHQHKQEKQLVKKKQQEDEDNDQIITANEKLLKSIVARQEAEIVQTLERVASEVPESMNDVENDSQDDVVIMNTDPAVLQHDGKDKSDDGHDEDEEDRLADEREKLRRLTDELEALKLDMQDYREECQRQQDQKIEELERQRALLQDREKVLAQREQVLTTKPSTSTNDDMTKTASSPVEKRSVPIKESLATSQGNQEDSQPNDVGKSSSTGVELVDVDNAAVVVDDVPKKETKKVCDDDVHHNDASDVGGGLDDAASFISSRSHVDDEVETVQQESSMKSPMIAVAHIPYAEVNSEMDDTDAGAFETIDAISKAVSTVLSSAGDEQDKGISTSRTCPPGLSQEVVTRHVASAAPKPAFPSHQRRRPQPVWTLDPSQIEADSVGPDGRGGGCSGVGGESDITTGLMNLFRAW